MSRTCRSILSSRKSALVPDEDTASIFPPYLADRRGDDAESSRLVHHGHHDLGRIDGLGRMFEIPPNVEPEVRLVVVGDERRRVDRIDGDALGTPNADDPLARNGAALGRETDRGREVDPAHRQNPRRIGIAGNAEDEIGRLGQAEPSAFVLGRARADLAVVLKVRIDGANHIDGGDLAAPRPRQRRHRPTRGRASAAPPSVSPRSICALPGRRRPRSSAGRGPRTGPWPLPAWPAGWPRAPGPSRRRCPRPRGGELRSDLTIWTSSPLWSAARSGEITPLIFAPTAELPMSV